MPDISKTANDIIKKFAGPTGKLTKKSAKKAAPRKPARKVVKTKAPARTAKKR
jgi:hypothetical protein